MVALRTFAAIMGLVASASVGHGQSVEAGIHLGVATCAGGNCHGAAERQAGSSIPGNEYVIWSKRDKHRQAYTVLLEERAIRMARAIGLPDAANQKLCLDCHADNVSPQLRGRQFQVADGIGCEACHGGASNWLGSHISGASHRDNIAAGLYPIEQPTARAQRCLGCHFGDEKRFVDHRLLAAGHPRLGFELDTFTATQPAHFVPDGGYLERKGRIDHLQVWATGQAVALVKRMDALMDPRHGRRGAFPEFAMYDCQSCHHPYNTANAPFPTTSGISPGIAKLYDANAAMVQTIAARISPQAARALSTHWTALQRAVTEDATIVHREAAAIRAVTSPLIPTLAGHVFTAADTRALADAVVALGQAPDAWRYSRAEQVTMALEAIAAAMRSSGNDEAPEDTAISTAIKALYASFRNEAEVRTDSFSAALRDFRRAIGK
jgi:hypothetical protein